MEDFNNSKHVTFQFITNGEARFDAGDIGNCILMSQHITLLSCW